MKLFSKKFYKINRDLHRDLGYLFIGLTLIYGISGVAVILRYLDVNVSYQKIITEEQLDKNLNKQQLKAYWLQHADDLPKITRVRVSSGDDGKEQIALYAKGGRGYYNPATGELKINIYKPRMARPFFKFVNEIHYNSGGKFTWIALVYAVMLVFFAISGAIMVKGKKGFMKRGIWLTLLGIAIPLILYFFF